MRIQQATFVKSAAGLADLPRDARPHVIFLGRSNVGKSSLLNALTGHKGLAHVSRTPGRTQLINLFDADGKLYLVDLPGYGYAKVPKPLQREIAERISSYVHGCERIRLAILICDAKVGPTADDLVARDLLADAGLPYLVIANKWDGLNMSGKAQATKRFASAFEGHDIIPHSTLSGEGRERILGKIGEALAR